MIILSSRNLPQSATNRRHWIPRRSDSQEAQTANLAANFFAVAHPSLTNYLEVAGGSNFTDDNPPDWGDANCQPNIVSGVNNDEANSTPICPIAGAGSTSRRRPSITTTRRKGLQAC